MFATSLSVLGQNITKQAEANAAYFKNEGVKSCTDKDDFIAEAKKLSSGVIDGVDFIRGGYRLELPIDIISVSGKAAQIDPSKNFISLEVIDFENEGKTVLMPLNVPEINQNATLSWSGKNVKLAAGISNGDKIVTLLRGTTPCATLMVRKAENKRLGLILSSK